MRPRTFLYLTLLSLAGCPDGGNPAQPSPPVSQPARDATVEPTEGGPNDTDASDAQDDFPYVDPGFQCGRSRHCGRRSDDICCVPDPSSLRRSFQSGGNNECQPLAECDAGVVVECDSHGDCANRGKPTAVCCVRYVRDGGADADAGAQVGLDAGADGDADAAPPAPAILTAVSCVEQVDCPAPDDILCDPDEPTPCPAGMQCVPHPVESTFSVCR